jgi:hypothetical protein
VCHLVVSGRPKRVADEGYAVPVHHVEFSSLVHLDDPDPVLAGTSEVSVLLARV